MAQTLPQTVEALLTNLKSNDDFQRKNAATELGELGIKDERIINSLKVLATSDRNKYVKSEANQSLNKLGIELSEAELQSTSTQATNFDPPTQPNPAVTYAPSAYSSSGYSALRGIATLCTALGWLIVGLAGLIAIGGLISMGDNFFRGAGIIIGSVFTGGFSFIILRVIAESISVLLDIEANTRRTAVILENHFK